MKPSKSTVILISLLLLCITVSVKAQNNLSSVKIFVPPSSVERLEVIRLLELDHFQEENGAIQTEIGEEELVKLKASNFRYEVQIENVADHLEWVNRPYFEGRKNGTINIDGTSKLNGVSNRVAFEQPGGLLDNVIVTPSAFQVWTGTNNLGGYYSYARMVTAIQNLYNTYSPSGLVDTFHIGLSVQGRIIYAIKISDNAPTDDSNEPEAFFQGVQHAREAIGGSSMIFLMQYLCERYTAGDSRIVNLVNNREIFIIPCMNPDGWEHNRITNANGGGGWRKNRRHISGPVYPTPGGVYGIDLNRNWSTDWGNCVSIPSSCASNDPDDDTYYGTGPFSEPEAQAVRNFIKSKHIVVANDQHSVGPYYSLPFGRPALHPAPDSLSIMQQRWYTAIPALMGKYNGMRAGNSFQALGYEVAGGVKDWMLKGEVGPGINGGQKYQIFGMTGEGGYGTTGAATFWPPATAIVTLCKGMTYQNLQMIYSAGSYVDIQDMTDIALPATSSGTLNFRIKRIGLLNQQVTVTAIPLANVSITSSPVIIASLPNFYDTYSGGVNYSLPGAITNGQYIQFAWKVETGGQVFYDTITKFYNPVVLVNDNMDTTALISTRWNISSGWNYLVDSGYAGSKALTESPNAAYPANANRTAQLRQTLDLTNSTAAYITFRTKHRAENFHDKLQVQVSPTGGAPWTNVAGKTTVREPGTAEGSTINGEHSLTGIEDDWVNEVFDISVFNNTAALRLRFLFTSDASSSFYAAQDGGFYIDDLKVIKSTVGLTTLPVHFISFTGRLLPDETIRLDWNAVTDQQHDYFEVERSANGISFTSIGGGPSSTPYWKIDPSPYIGNNFYRIKQVDKDGTITYSHTVNVYYNPERFTAFVYPNPVTNMLNVKINSERSDQYTISISDLAGRKVHEEKAITGSSGREINIDFKQQAAQMYILTIRNGKNEIVATQKIAKQ
jgi:hypothetical protein